MLGRKCTESRGAGAGGRLTLAGVETRQSSLRDLMLEDGGEPLGGDGLGRRELHLQEHRGRGRWEERRRGEVSWKGPNGEKCLESVGRYRFLKTFRKIPLCAE